MVDRFLGLSTGYRHLEPHSVPATLLPPRSGRLGAAIAEVLPFEAPLLVIALVPEKLHTLSHSQRPGRLERRTDAAKDMQCRAAAQVPSVLQAAEGERRRPRTGGGVKWNGVAKR